MFFSVAILSLCMFSFKVVASAEYNLEIINFKQLVHAINIGWAHENKFKLHKNVSLIKFSKKNKKKTCQQVKKSDQTSPSLFFPHGPRTLRVLINWHEHAHVSEQLCVSKKFAVFVSRSVFRQKNKNVYLF